MTDVAPQISLFASAFDDLATHVQVGQVLDQLVLDVERNDMSDQVIELEMALDATHQELGDKRAREVELRSELQKLHLARSRDAKEAAGLQQTWQTAFNHLANELQEKERYSVLLLLQSALAKLSAHVCVFSGSTQRPPCKECSKRLVNCHDPTAMISTSPTPVAYYASLTRHLRVTYAPTFRPWPQTPE